MSNNKPQVTVKLRREWVLKELLKGNSNSNIKKEWKEKYQKTDHSFQNDLHLCYKRFKKFIRDNNEDLIANHIARYDRNAEEAYDREQYSASNQALAFKEKLLRLHAAESQTFIQNNTINVENLEETQIRELLDKYDNEK